jgi:hypothetical protein
MRAMKALSCAAATGALLLAASALQAPVNAATITEVTDAGAFAGNTVTGSGTNELGAEATGYVALAYSTDWIEFTVAPTSLGSVDIVVNDAPFGAGPSYPSEMWELVSGTVGGTVIQGPTSAPSTDVLVTLGASTNYFLELVSGSPPFSCNGACQGQSPISIAVENAVGPAVPLPGALGLFAGGLGLLGFAGLRKSRKTGRGLTSLATA